jgi:hypothetical protein
MLAISVNNVKYTLSCKQLDKFPESNLFKVFNGDDNDNEFIVKDESDSNHIYLMVDNDSGEYLISYLKGHTIRPHTVEENVLVKLFEDSKNLNLTDLTACIAPYITASTSPTVVKSLITTWALLLEKTCGLFGFNGTGIVESVNEYLESPTVNTNIELIAKEEYGKKNLHKGLFFTLYYIILQKVMTKLLSVPTVEPPLGENTNADDDSVYSYCEIIKGNSCGKTNYVIANGKIYDVTTLLNNHPGGDNVLMNTISTLDDQSKNISMHAIHLQQKIDRLKIGSVCKCSKYCLLCMMF